MRRCRYERRTLLRTGCCPATVPTDAARVICARSAEMLAHRRGGAVSGGVVLATRQRSRRRICRVRVPRVQACAAYARRVQASIAMRLCVMRRTRQVAPGRVTLICHAARGYLPAQRAKRVRCAARMHATKRGASPREQRCARQRRCAGVQFACPARRKVDAICRGTTSRFIRVGRLTALRCCVALLREISICDIFDTLFDAAI